MTMVPPMEPTRPPTNLPVLLDPEDPEELSELAVAAVGTVTKVVIVVLGPTLKVDTYSLALDELCVDVGVNEEDVVVTEEKLDDVELGTNSEDDSMLELELSELDDVSVELELVVRDEVVSVDDEVDDENSSEDSVEVVDVLEDSDKVSEDDDDDEKSDDEEDEEDEENDDSDDSDEDDSDSDNSDDSDENDEDDDVDEDDEVPDELELVSELAVRLELEVTEPPVRLSDENRVNVSVSDRLGKLLEVSKLSPVENPKLRVWVGSREAINENDGVARDVGELIVEENSGEFSDDVNELRSSAACVVEVDGKKSVVEP